MLGERHTIVRLLGSVTIDLVHSVQKSDYPNSLSHKVQRVIPTDGCVAYYPSVGGELHVPWWLNGTVSG